METRAGLVRRIDALLRGTFPNLITRIFEITHEQFLIVFDPAQQNATTISPEFDHSIRFATVGVKLANNKPAAFIRELQPLTDAEAAGGLVGLPLTISDFNTLVAARFPQIPFRGVQEDFDNRAFHVMVSAPISAALARQVIAFTDGLALPFTSDVKLEEQLQPTLSGEEPKKYQPSQNPLKILAPHARPTAPLFVRSDDIFWFENLEAAASGRLPFERFPGANADAFRCYIDSSFGQHINLRQALLLYDEVFWSLPLKEAHDAFLHHQGLSEADLLDAIDSGRLKLISIQPEERLNLTFLEAASERRSNAILGRRTASLLLISDLANTADHYRLANQELFSLLPDLAEAIGPLVGLNSKICLQVLLWPLAARRRSISGLLEEGTKKGPALMLGGALGEALLKIRNIDARVDSFGLSERVHIGHALNATVFPAISDPGGYQPLMSILGSELNFYRSFNTSIAAAWAGNETRHAEGIRVLPPIPFLEFDRKIPLVEILQDSALGSTRAQGRALMHRLADLPIEERAPEIDRLTDRFRRRWRLRDPRIWSFDNLETGLSIASIIGHATLVPIMGPVHLAAQAAQELRRLPVFDRFMQSFEGDLSAMRGSNQDLDFLSKIQRVAQLRRDRV